MDTLTLALALSYVKKQVEEAKKEGFKVQVEQDRSILDRQGEEKVFYFLPKSAVKPSDGYDEFVYANNKWEQVGATDVDLSAYATQVWVREQINSSTEISIGDNSPEEGEILWIDTDDDTIPYGYALRIQGKTLSLLDQNNQELSSVAITGKTDISSGKATINTNTFTYDGTNKEPTVTSVELNGITLEEDVDYAVSSYPVSAAGNYILKVYGINDYDGVIPINWSIEKAPTSISGVDTIIMSSIGQVFTTNYTADGDGIFSFTLSDDSKATLSNTGGQLSITSVSAGSIFLTVTIQEGTNYLSATKQVEVVINDGVCFGVAWNYGTTSPILTRMTKLTDPLGIVTHSPDIEPTACIGNDGNGQSYFDNYMPWSGMIRKNYVNGEIVDFTGYDNGETYVYIPKFYSKIVNDTEQDIMYFYISSIESNGFTLHPGSGHYMSRYECDTNFLSKPGTYPKVNTNLTNFRNGITAIDNYHHQYDIHTYNALMLLYLVEFANFNTQSIIGKGVTSGTAQVLGQTDTLTYHTGRIDGNNDTSSIQYRWIENLWGNVWNWVDGILIDSGKVYICNDSTKYSSTITNDYIDTGLVTPSGNGWHKTDNCYNNCYLIPATLGGSDSTYTCDYYYYYAGLRGLRVGGGYGDGSAAGLFCWAGFIGPGSSSAGLGGRAVLVDE